MKKIGISLLIMISASMARAGFLIEPHVAYESMNLKVTAVSDDSVSKSKASYFGYGALLGYKFAPGIYVGLDYSAESGTIKDNGSDTTSADYDFSSSGAGLGLGYEYGMYRIYMVYGPSLTFTLKPSSGDTKFTGTTMKLGLGVRPMRYFVVSFEYTSTTLSKFTVSGVDFDVATYLYKSQDIKTMGLNFSFPYDFGGK